jgi:hypothetical protein
MIMISVQASSGTTRFRVAIQVKDIEQAVEIAARQNPGNQCEATFPIYPESFFVEDSVATFRPLAA